MKIKILRNSFFICSILFTFIIFINENISFINDSNRYINVNVNGVNNRLKLGSKIEDLNINNRSYSNDYVLHNNEYIEENNDYKNKISINNADINDLVKLPGIGIKTANKIIEYRLKFNGFKSLEELKDVSGIGDKKYEEIKELIAI